MASLFVFGLSGILLVLATDFATILLVRVVQGTAAAGIFITTVTIIGDTFVGVQRNAVLGVNTAVSRPVRRLPYRGWCARRRGVERALPRVSAWPAARARRRSISRGTRPRARDPWPRVPPRGGNGARRHAGGCALRGGVHDRTPAVRRDTHDAAVFHVVELRPDAGDDRTGVGRRGAIVGGRLGDERTTGATSLERRSHRYGFACYGIGLLGTWLASSPLAITGTVLVFSAGIGLTMPAVDADIAGLVAERFRAGALSIRNSTTFLGRSLGLVAFAGLAVMVDYRPLLLAGVIVAFAGALLAAAATEDGLRVARHRSRLPEAATETEKTGNGYSNRRRVGFSRNSSMRLVNCAAMAPSSTRWSNDSDNVITCRGTTSPSMTRGFSLMAPSARIATSG